MTAHGRASTRSAGDAGTRSHPSLAVLRTATAHLHAELDAALDLTSPALDRDRYGRVLIGIAAVVGPLEDRIAAAGVPLEDWAARRRAALIAADVAALGLEVPDRAADDSGGATEPLTPDAALGAAYVLEGSLLGGRVVSAAVRRALGEGAPTRWFRPGGDVADRWLRCCGAVADRADAGGEVCEMADGARAAYGAFLARAWS